MGFAGNLARGLLQGGSHYFGKVAETREFDRRAEALDARERARDALRAQQQKEQTEHAGTVATRTYRSNRATDVDAELTLLPAKTRATITANQASQATEQTYRERTLAIQHQYGLNEIQARTAAQIEHDLTVAGAKVGRMEVSRDGRLIVFNEKGDILRATKPGTFNPSNVPDDDDDYTPAVPARGAASAPAAKPRAAAPAKGTSQQAQAIAQLESVYGSATPAQYPQLFRNGRKIPLGDARKMVISRYPD